MTAELVVFIDGHARQITGAVEDSTTSEIVTALANANNKIGKFSLVLLNQTNNVEYYLRTSDFPFQILNSLKERGIDACLEVREVDQAPVDPFDYSTQNADQKIYACLPARLGEFERMLGTLSDFELEELVQEQDKTLWQHQIKIVGLEGEMTEEHDREYLQLLKQRHNLRQTLNELNTVDWKRQHKYERNQLNNLASNIERLKHELNKKECQLEEILNELDKFDSK